MYIQEIRLLSIVIMLPLLFLGYVCYELWVNPSLDTYLRAQEWKFIFPYSCCFPGRDRLIFLLIGFYLPLPTLYIGHGG